MKKIFRIIVGLLLIVLGFYMVFNPAITLISIAVLIGFAILSEGVSDLVGYFKDEDKNTWELVTGIINALFGLLILFSRAFLIISAILPVILGLWLTFKGIIRIPVSIYLKKTRPNVWLSVIASGILCLIIGIIMLLNPILPVITISGVLSIGLIFSGVSEIFGNRRKFTA